MKDPSLRLLSRVADYVEPLTRFDRGHLSLESNEQRTVEVVARQRFRISFDLTRTEGQGELPAGVVSKGGREAFLAESEAQLASARAAAPARLAQWASAHGENPARRPAISDCFVPAPEIGYCDDCAACKGKGKIGCTACQASGAQKCPTCEGRGARPCTACEATGRQRCNRCYGQGYEIVHRQEKVWDSATNSGHTRNVPERQTCGGCGGAGSVTCLRCSGQRQVSCTRCSGQGAIPCSACSGAGTQTCGACDGAGHKFWTSRLVCSIVETFDVSTRHADANIAGTLKTLASIGEVLAYAEAYRSTAEADAASIDRQIIASVPVVSITVAVGVNRAQVHGFGPALDIHDYGNIAGLLLGDDLHHLETALPAKTRPLTPPPPALNDALVNTLASEVNVAIAENPGEKGSAVVQEMFAGLFSTDHLQRTSAAIGKAINLAYWAAMLRGPIAVLAMPLLQAPVEYLLAGQSEGAKLSAMAGVMLLAFGGAILAHMLVVRGLQRRLAPSGAPDMFRITSRRRQLRTWLIGAGGFVVLATLAVAGLTRLVTQ